MKGSDDNSKSNPKIINDEELGKIIIQDFVVDTSPTVTEEVEEFVDQQSEDKNKTEGEFKTTTSATPNNQGKILAKKTPAQKIYEFAKGIFNRISKKEPSSQIKKNGEFVKTTRSSHFDTIAELEQLEAEDKISEQLATSKITFWEKYFPAQTITLIGIVGIVGLIFTGGICFIPLDGQKETLEKKLNALGITTRIEGRVYFNPFLMSFTVNNSYVDIPMGVRPGAACKSSVLIFSPVLKISILSGAISIDGAQIDLKTDGDGMRAYGAISSFDFSRIARSIGLKNSIVSIGSCTNSPTGEKLNESEMAKRLATSGDVRGYAAKAKSSLLSTQAVLRPTTQGQGGLSESLITIAIPQFTFYKSNSTTEGSGIISFEGQTIDIDYEIKSSLVQSWKIQSAFANAQLNINIDPNSDKKKAGSFSFNILDGQTFSYVVGIRPSDKLYKLFVGLVLRSSGDISYFKNSGIVVNAPIALSHGNGIINIVAPVANNAGKPNPEAIINVKIPEFKLINNEVRKSRDSAAAYIGLWRLPYIILSSFSHRLNFDIGLFKANDTAISNIKIAYLMKNGMLDSSQSNLSFESDSVKVMSIHEPSINSAQVQSGKDFLLPLHVEGGDLYKMIGLVRSLFNFGLVQSDPSIVVPKSQQYSKKIPFSGNANLFLNYTKMDYGLDGINLTIDDIGLITGKCIIDDEIGSRGVLETTNKIEVDITKMDITGLIDSALLMEIINPINPFRVCSFVYNFARLSGEIPNYDLDVRMGKVLYKGKKVVSFGTKISKRERIFKIAELVANSEVFSGKGELSIDVSSVDYPLLNISLDADILDVKTFLSPAPKDIIKPDGFNITSLKIPTSPQKEVSVKKEFSFSKDNSILGNDNSSFDSISSKSSGYQDEVKKPSPDDLLINVTNSGTKTLSLSSESSDKTINNATTNALVSSTQSKTAETPTVTTNTIVATPPNMEHTTQQPTIQKDDSSIQGLNKISSPMTDAQVVNQAKISTGKTEENTKSEIKTNDAPKNQESHNKEEECPKTQIIDTGIISDTKVARVDTISSSLIIPKRIFDFPSKEEKTEKQSKEDDKSALSTKQEKEPTAKTEDDPYDFGDDIKFVSRNNSDSVRPVEKYLSDSFKITMLDKVDGVININVRNLIFPAITFDGFIAEARIDEGQFKVSRLFAKSGPSTVEARGIFDLSKDLNVKFEAIGEKIPLKSILAFFMLDPTIDGTLGFGGKFKASKRNIGEFLRNILLELEFDSQDMIIRHPNIAALYGALGSGRHISPLEADTLIKHPGTTKFTSTAGNITLAGGVLTSPAIIMREVGYSGVAKISVNLIDGSIDLIRTNFMVLGYKPWSLSGKRSERFIKIPISTGVSGSLNSMRTVSALDRVNEYLRELDKYDRESEDEEE